MSPPDKCGQEQAIDHLGLMHNPTVYEHARKKSTEKDTGQGRVGHIRSRGKTIESDNSTWQKTDFVGKDKVHDYKHSAIAI